MHTTHHMYHNNTHIAQIHISHMYTYCTHTSHTCTYIYTSHTLHTYRYISHMCNIHMSYASHTYTYHTHIAHAHTHTYHTHTHIAQYTHIENMSHTSHICTHKYTYHTHAHTPQAHFLVPSPIYWIREHLCLYWNPETAAIQLNESRRLGSIPTAAPPLCCDGERYVGRTLRF